MGTDYGQNVSSPTAGSLIRGPLITRNPQFRSLNYVFLTQENTQVMRPKIENVTQEYGEKIW